MIKEKDWVERELERAEREEKRRKELIGQGYSFSAAEKMAQGESLLDMRAGG